MSPVQDGMCSGKTYEGILTVTDAEAFRNALVKGIGREKAFGMGMLTVTRVMI